jgi:hypothetical protein
MAHTLTSHHGYVHSRTSNATRRVADDPLGAMRGIVTGVLVSLVGFWLPLAIVLTIAH